MPQIRTLVIFLLGCVALLVAAGPAISLSQTMDTVDYGVSFSDVISLPHAQPSQAAAYGSEVLQTVVQFAPSGKTKADIVLIHGGCWSNAYSRDHLSPLASALATAGYTVWLPEYRRVGDIGGGWPGSFDDVKAVLAYVAEQTESPLIAMGHSAGGHLVLLAAQKSDPRLDGVLALAPITDPAIYGAQEGSCQGMVREFLGGDLEDQLDIYQAASVEPHKLPVPATLLLGTEDPIVGIDQIAGFPPEQMRLIEGAGHFDLIHPKTAAFAIVLEKLNLLIRAGDTP